MKNVAVCVLFLVSLCVVPSALAGGSHMSVLSVGVKVSWVLGSEGGFTMGPEVSYLWGQNDGRVVGVLVDADYSARHDRHRVHIGIETHTFNGRDGIPLGGSIGPTWIKENGTSRFGGTVTFYIPTLVVPFVAFTPTSGGDLLPEVGIYGKFPVIWGGRLFD
jgi:hypothetical protein